MTRHQYIDGMKYKGKCNVDIFVNKPQTNF